MLIGCIVKRIKVVSILLILSFLLLYSRSLLFVKAESLFNEVASVPIYSVYDEKLNLLFQREEVWVGDNYLSEDFKFYEITYIDEDNMYAIAKFITQKQPPEISRSKLPKPIKVEDRIICMYMTHNDESYLPTDGVDSIYGNGGIRDVALSFKRELEKHMVDVYLDDTLHIPHNSSAYSRSKVTAEKLQEEYSPDAIFDIHRDGTSRKFYVTNVNGVERGRVRMVIGKANPNMALNEEFALYLMSVGKEKYPWLFTDIYYASGHYNQALDSKAILFEMGSHLVEKDLVIDTMTELADVVVTAMYDTTVNNETGELVIDGVESDVNMTINNAMDMKENKSGSPLFAIALVFLIMAGMCVTLFVIFVRVSSIKNITEIVKKQ